MIARSSAPLAGLALLCAGLGLGLLAELTVRPIAPGTLPAPAPGALPAVPSMPRFVPAAVTELAARPLFSMSRRPMPVEAPAPEQPAAASAPPPPVPATELTLIGVIESAGQRLAVIRVQGATEPVRVGEGATVDRWQVARIAADHVVLSAAGSEQDLRFPPPRPGQAGMPGRPRQATGPRP